MRTIKYQFAGTAIAIAFFLLSLGFFTNLSIRRTYQNYDLIQSAEKLRTLSALMAKTKKEFILREPVNPEFFTSGQSGYLTLMDSLMKENFHLLSSLEQNRVVNKLNLNGEINVLKEHFSLIQSYFNSLRNAVYEYGFESHGLSGKMRAHIHSVERALETMNQYELTIMMLMLRRHEKNFMLRKDKRHLERFEQTMENFIQRMNELGVNNELVTLAKNYQLAFFELAEKEMEIGTIAGQGLLKQINDQFMATDPLIKMIQDTIGKHSEKQVSLYLWILISAFITLSLAIILVYYRLSGRIVPRLSSMRSYLGRIGNGELPERMEYKGNDEIKQMVDSINNLTDNLKNTRTFAIEVGKGNFHTDINVFGNQGDLGGSLIQMKNQLEEVARKQKEQKEEERQRNWVAEGTALFAGILRQNNDNLPKLIETLVINLVKYTGANQGGLFLLNEQGDERYFELAGCYAYDRKKFLQKRVEWGEGLIGACALEKEFIYITDLPKNYIRITSGLGDVPPDFIIIIPLIHEDKIFGVIEIAGFKGLENYKRDFLNKISGSIASQISISKSNLINARLLQKSEEMARVLKQQEFELKQSMEELLASQEESGRVIESMRRELITRDGSHSGYITKSSNN